MVSCQTMSDERKRLTATIELPPNTVSAVCLNTLGSLIVLKVNAPMDLLYVVLCNSNIPAFTNLFDSVPTTTSSSTASHDSILTAPQSASSSHNLASETVSRTPTNIQNATENIFTETAQ
ncbi:Uncharacterized protein APZ42_025849 [Daphnia magna]|uniref:Uncharacterized protein n=1 Tax=Daphnia magna TaxID=35525 RepID=A0A162EEJ9_9CRUS|nr:Uncharacterized protein APZ42_025849 [Daphnia magna]